jgi:hypothetical protein
VIRFSRAGAMPSLATPPLMLHFVRLVDPANVAAITATSAPPEIKQEHVLGMLTATGIVRARYSTQIHLGAPLAGELTDIQIFQLHLLAVAAELSAKAAEEVGREQGIDLVTQWQATIYKSMRTSYLGIVESLTETHIYDAGQRTELAMALTEAWPAVRPILTAADRPRLRELMAKAQERAGDDEAKPALATLAAAVTAD